MKIKNKSLFKNQKGFTLHYIFPVFVILVIALIGVRIYFKSSAQTTNCLPDPAAAIASLTPGATWNGNNQCYITTGIMVSNPVLIENATFNDPVALTKPDPASVKAVIHINKTNNVTLSNITINGQNLIGGYHGDPYVGEEGVKITSSSNITINNVNTNNTFGDGLYMNTYPRTNESSNITVNGMVITNAGRQGVTVAIVKDSTINNVNIVSSADTGWDFETDVNDGSSNITINNPVGRGLYIQSILKGPIYVNNANLTGRVQLIHSAAQSGQLVTFNNGNISLPPTDSGIDYAGIIVDGPGKLKFNNIKFGHKIPKGGRPPSGPDWSAQNGAILTFNHCSFEPPLGTNDSLSTVKIN